MKAARVKAASVKAARVKAARVKAVSVKPGRVGGSCSKQHGSALENASGVNPGVMGTLEPYEPCPLPTHWGSETEPRKGASQGAARGWERAREGAPAASQQPAKLDGHSVGASPWELRLWEHSAPQGECDRPAGESRPRPDQKNRGIRP